MPKPVKKTAKKRTKPSRTDRFLQPGDAITVVSRAKKPATDPNKRAHQLMDAHLDKLNQGKWTEPAVTPAVDPFEEQFRKRMAELGRKGGKASGAKRMQMPERQRKEIAKRAAAARWGKTP